MIKSFSKPCQMLAHGIFIPEFDIMIPWLITEPDLYALIPREEFSTSEGGCWPELEFTLWGFKVKFGFNFVTDQNKRFTEVQYRNTHSRQLKRTYRKSAKHLSKSLGRPNFVDFPRAQQTWRFDTILIENHMAAYRPTPKTTLKMAHHFSVHKLQDSVQINV